jgi:DNA (cytosine-5)-methyltransferase 1
MEQMKHISICAGGGGFDLAATWMDWINVLSCEKNPLLRSALAYYWPDAYHHDDLFTLTPNLITDELNKRFGCHWHPAQLIFTGGIPCQPFSDAGKRKGTADDRYLWPPYLKIIRAIRPGFAILENVPGINVIEDGMVFEGICTDLAAIGYEVIPFEIPACATNAPHRRDRVFIIAYTNRGADGQIRDNQTACQARRAIIQTNEKERPRKDIQHHGCSGLLSGAIKINPHSCCQGLQGNEQPGTFKQRTRASRSVTEPFDNEHWINAATRLCVVDDGIPGRLDAKAIYPERKKTSQRKAYKHWKKESFMMAGNAVQPQVVYQIFRMLDLWVLLYGK